jgi:hypothetical protein
MYVIPVTITSGKVSHTIATALHGYGFLDKPVAIRNRTANGYKHIVLGDFFGNRNESAQ